MPPLPVFILPVPLRPQLAPCTLHSPPTQRAPLRGRARPRTTALWGSTHRDARWLAARPRSRAAASWPALAALCGAELCARARRARKREALAKACASAALLACAALAWLAYGALNRATSASASAVSRAAIAREVSVGRLTRLSLRGGARFGATALLPGGGDVPVSAPEVQCAAVEVRVGRVVQALVKRRALAVDVVLDQPVVSVKQVLETAANGELVGRWDAGLPLQEEAAPSGVEPAPAILPIGKKWQETMAVQRGEGSEARGPLVVPGKVVATNATVFLHPTDFGVYGQGTEVIEVRGANAEVYVRDQDDRDLMTGVAVAHAAGLAVNGGDLDVTATCDLAKAKDVRSGDPIVDLNVVGHSIPARNVAAFLNMPFRADNGSVDGNLGMCFLYDVDVLVPDMHGTATLNGVSLRFHPDPATPEFRKVAGQLRFEDKIMFMDGPTGDLGSLPMTMSGSIDLVGDYDLVGHVRNVDVNDVIDTFDVDKFVPVTGRLKGEATMRGPLKEPYICGRVVSLTSGSFDKVPVEKAVATFEWDAIAGVFELTSAQADISGGGSVSGSGGMYFDMTMVTPYEMSAPAHHSRSPKAPSFPDGTPRQEGIPPPPRDDMDIDLHAPARPYDSMLFNFSIRGAVGGNLISWYGSEEAGSARYLAGLVDGDAVIAGHAKDANCRALWRTTSPPPPVAISSSGLGRSAGSDVGASQPEGDKDVREDAEVYVRQKDGPLLQAAKDVNPGEVSNSAAGESFPGSDGLGGGDLRGAVFMKLGDLPAARRVKVRTTIANLDLRRLGWGDESLREGLANSPAMIFNGDMYFRGVLNQQLLPVEPGSGKNPRTPEADLLGVEGALAVRGVSLNSLKFSENLTGSLFLSKKDLKLTLEERIERARSLPPRDSKANGSSTNKANGDTPESKKGSKSRGGEKKGEGVSPEARPNVGPQEKVRKDQIRLSGSLGGKGFVSLRCGKSELVLSVDKDDINKTRASIFARDFRIENILGGNGKSTDGIPCASISADGIVNIDNMRGDGSLNLENGRFSGVELESLVSVLQWRGKSIFLQRCVAKVGGSDYHVEASYNLAGVDSAEQPSWEVQVSVPSADIRDVVGLFKNRRTSRQGDTLPSTLAARSCERQSARSGKRSSRSDEDLSGSDSMSWAVADGSFEDQLRWFANFVEDDKERSKREKIIGEAKFEKPSVRGPSVSDLAGRVYGSLTVRYRGNESGSHVTHLENSKIPPIFVQAIANSFVEFKVEGDEVTLGTRPIGRIQLDGGFSEGRLSVDSLSLQGRNNFEAFLKASLGANGEISGSAFVQDANASTLVRYLRGKFRMSGLVSARVDVGGVVSDPIVDGRAVWTDGTLNGEAVRDAQNDFYCRNGRCTLDLNARFGGRRNAGASETGRLDVRESLLGKVGIESQSAQPDDEEKQVVVEKPVLRGRGHGEPLRFSMSAPVRFYVLEHIRRTSSVVWEEVEPLIQKHGDDDSISIDVDIRKYGLLLLNAAFPDLGWIDGRSDLLFKVSGTLEDPRIAGRASVSDGSLWPSELTKPLENIRGEVSFDDDGTVSVRSFSGRYNGRPVAISGSLPISRKHRDRIETAARTVIPRGQPVSRASRRLLVEKRADATAKLDRFSRGIVCDIGDVVFDLRDHFYGRISGRLVVKKSLLAPCLGGAVSITRGVIYLASPPITPEAALSAMPNLIPQVRPSGGRREPEPDADREQENTSETKKLESKRKASLPAVKSEDGAAETSGPSMEVEFSDLKLALGKDVRVVYPYVMNFGTTGVVSLSGTSLDPVPSGTIRLTQGEVNLLTSKMEVRGGADNFVRFESLEDAKDPVVSLELEYRDMVLQVKEARISEWSRQLTILDKRGEQFEGGTWADIVQDRLEELQRGLEAGVGIPNLIAKYFINSYSLKGKLGPTQWRMYPTFASSQADFAQLHLQSYSRGELVEDLGIGAQFDYGKFSLSGRFSLRGIDRGSMTFFPSDRVKVELESNGPISSLDIEVLLSGRDKGPRPRKHRKPRNREKALAQEKLKTDQNVADSSEADEEGR